MKEFSPGGGVMQLSNDTSKNSTSPPYLVKNERSLRFEETLHEKMHRSFICTHIRRLHKRHKPMYLPLMHERANQGLQVHSKVMLNGQLRVCKMSPYIWKQRNSSEALSYSVQWSVSRKVRICVYGLATRDKQWLLDKCVHYDKIVFIMTKLIWRFVLCY